MWAKVVQSGIILPIFGQQTNRECSVSQENIEVRLMKKAGLNFLLILSNNYPITE
jgi:hypothetical protein